MPRSGQSTFGPHSAVDEPNWDTERMAALLAKAAKLSSHKRMAAIFGALSKSCLSGHGQLAP